MNKIRNIEKITGLYPEWKPVNIAYIKKLEWKIGKLSIIVLCQLKNKGIDPKDLSKNFFEAEVIFENVINLKMKFNGRTYQQVLGFDILDVSQNGLEDINFEIEDYENGTIHFYCQYIQIENVSKPDFLDAFAETEG
ncbi:hypothetical protein [Pinibacter aurantiacus]|uniref:Uncharacterized protein n=1 Tax=Pinibacter aurantiacus TaxID=2851599 RepID=A0A9E2W588_9BACT|nr:hypothetical protein [Pinibacter aurantiacus]MBV4360600.1 hypothetical protein [Pinibacter aurantiacus]